MMKRFDFYGMIIGAFRGKSRSHNNMKQYINKSFTRGRSPIPCHVPEAEMSRDRKNNSGTEIENTLEYFLRSPGHLLCHLQCVTQHPSIDSLLEEVCVSGQDNNNKYHTPLAYTS